ncbi:F0F1 ATP synthase subunit A [Clostridium sp. SYSU_GA19001]|uniref:F0F1 ATP synthase subunit A n=1 Tax=Clostridium caldaquaticum TaxID=2940653 RepID=UPI00207737E8|nr:F0F1 ATP synthase subunit A [Clostridium caldaquaticum]
MGEAKYLFKLSLFGQQYGFSENIVIQWVIIILFGVLSILFTRGLKRVPGKKQAVAEMIVEYTNSFVKSNIGEKYTELVPYVGSLILFLLAMNLTGLVGIEPPTMDYSVALGMALTSFFIIQVYAIKKVGIGHYFLGYGKPVAFLAPMNILERILLPVSLSLRLFGNMTAAATIMTIIYKGLEGITWFAQLVIPIPLHVYFDIFDGAVQMIVFTMLTMINLKVIVEH